MAGYLGSGPTTYDTSFLFQNPAFLDSIKNNYRGLTPQQYWDQNPTSQQSLMQLFGTPRAVQGPSVAPPALSQATTTTTPTAVLTEGPTVESPVVPALQEANPQIQYDSDGNAVIATPPRPDVAKENWPPVQPLAHPVSTPPPPPPAAVEPVLRQGAATGVATQQVTPALLNNGNTLNSQGPLDTGSRFGNFLGTLTGNKRDATGSNIPRNQIGFSEGLMRAGGAIMEGSQRGGVAGLSAGLKAYGDIQDYNRQGDTDAFKLEEARRTAKALADSKAAAAGAKGLGDASEEVMNLQVNLDQMEGVLGSLSRGGVTGMFDGTVRSWWDSATGDEKANIRLTLQSIKVDQTLLKTARTKGAISDKEMNLFQSDVPAITADEKVWIRFIQERAAVLRKAIAAQGGAVPPPVSDPLATTTPTALSPEAQALVDKYK